MENLGTYCILFIHYTVLNNQTFFSKLTLVVATDRILSFNPMYSMEFQGPSPVKIHHEIDKYRILDLWRWKKNIYENFNIIEDIERDDFSYSIHHWKWQSHLMVYKGYT